MRLSNMGKQQQRCGVPVICIDDGKIYNSVRHVARTFHVSEKTVGNHLDGKNSIVGGLTFERFQRSKHLKK
jgi:hypothetical protein